MNSITHLSRAHQRLLVLNQLAKIGFVLQHRSLVTYAVLLWAVCGSQPKGCIQVCTASGLAKFSQGKFYVKGTFPMIRWRAERCERWH